MHGNTKSDADVRPNVVEADQLFEATYEALRTLASRARRQSPSTFRTTSLVHEAYLRLTKDGQSPFYGEGHFLGIAAVAMKRLIIDEYRRRATQKRGSTHGVEPLSPENAIFNDGFNTDLLDLDRSLRRLEEIDSVKSRIVELRFFGGCTVRQVAAAIGMSSTAVAREWNLARAWLYRDLNDRTSTVERSDG